MKRRDSDFLKDAEVLGYHILGVLVFILVVVVSC